MRFTNQALSMKQRKKALREEARGVKDWAIDCLREPEAGLQEKVKVVESKKTVVRVIELRSDRLRPKYHLASVKVEEYDV